MRKILDKWDRLKLGHKLHQLQKRYNRAVGNGYTEKVAVYERRIKQIIEKINKIK